MAATAGAGLQSYGSTVQRDWESRELTEVVQLNVLQIVQFLNRFDVSTRFKLAQINEKLNKLERLLEYCEAAVRSTVGS